ncbi:DUF2634 domain-containing protein [Peribacillus huizhouensis]|uniref:DUF2634 domain-containing protein n=1 Tax=Peribacillus huizhouensis TaxID=1501239 RepID=A0ABR6CSC2_9BACI|nr:DUF2634 domain-containing protein [Peribacillus huizhouensis]MBA9027510.1 hypothetical protein [Peribacillus huizhouensis]
MEPSKTWSIDFENGSIGGFIDNETALIQFARKAIMTERTKYAIYSDNYGCELHGLIGDDVTPALLDAEIPRLIYETLAYDDRISDVVDIEYTREGDALFVSCRIIPTQSDADFVLEVTM